MTIRQDLQNRFDRLSIRLTVNEVARDYRKDKKMLKDWGILKDVSGLTIYYGNMYDLDGSRREALRDVIKALVNGDIS